MNITIDDEGLRSYSLWAGRDLYRATLAVIWNFGLHGLFRKTTRLTAPYDKPGILGIYVRTLWSLENWWWVNSRRNWLPLNYTGSQHYYVYMYLCRPFLIFLYFLHFHFHLLENLKRGENLVLPLLTFTFYFPVEYHIVIQKLSRRIILWVYIRM